MNGQRLKASLIASLAIANRPDHLNAFDVTMARERLRTAFLCLRGIGGSLLDRFFDLRRGADVSIGHGLPDL